jgi:hypothetical protein
MLAPANAQGPIAIVEEVDSKSAGVELMDYLRIGKTIVLGSGDKLVIGYLRSCWRETISGGTVTVGTEQSAIAGGHVDRVKVRCEAEAKGTVSKETVGSGAMVFRKKPGDKPRQQTIYGLSPVIEVGKASSLVIERLDQPATSIQINLAERPRGRDEFYDLATSSITLIPGALYRVKAGPREATFRIDQLAEPKATGIVGRLVHMSPPG